MFKLKILFFIQFFCFFRELINCGLLLIKNQDSYLVSFPSSGNFIKHYIEGRKYLIQIIKRRKFQEILENVSCFEL